MTKINELTIDGVKTSSFKCEILVEHDHKSSYPPQKLVF